MSGTSAEGRGSSSSAGAADGSPRADADPGDGRHESLNERMDRNWNELLQELRVTQTGTQILTGFLLSVAFQQRFESLTLLQRRLYLGLIVTAVITTALALTPVNLHRALFRRHAKVALVSVSNVLLRLVLLGVGLVLAGTVVLIFDVVSGRGPAVAAGVTSLVLLLAIAWLSRVVRSRSGRS